MHAEAKIMDFIVVGAVFWGSVIAQKLAENGKNFIVFEKRAHIGGRCSSEIEANTGIEVHKYESHIFHTSNFFPQSHFGRSINWAPKFLR